MPLFAIIDVETTGGSPEQERITEIAIVLHDGEKVVDTFSSLVNPERSIPYNITRITGITDAMVANAPKFYEVAKQVAQMTEDAIFVAHNVRFDFGFIREEYKRLGYTYTRKRLCTVQLTRKVFPGLRSYSLTNLKKHFGIEAERAHRALDDTLATVKVFEYILAEQNKGNTSLKQFINLGVKEAKLPPSITLDELHALPETCGVYYFYDKAKEVVYVGKSINIKKRVFEHFADQTKKATALHSVAHSLSYTDTGSELAALLLESAEIKRLLPPINRAQRIRSFKGAIFRYLDQNGYLNLAVGSATAANRKKMEMVADYPKATSAKAHLESLIRRFELCRKMCNVEASRGACFHFTIKECHGACVGQESVDEYNERVQEALNTVQNRLEGTFVLVEAGRNDSEKVLVCVVDGLYQGFAFIEEDTQLSTLEDILEAVETSFFDPEAGKIIQGYMERKRVKKLLF